jgi:hypothetical protein
MTRSTATPQPSIIIPVWPVGTNDRSRRRAGRPPQLQGHRHLADGAVRPTVRITRLPGQMPAPDRGLLAVRRRR